MAATGSRALAEFGVLAGMGIICCFIALFFILPSVLLWFVKRDPARARIPKVEYRFIARLGQTTFRHKWVTLTLGLIVTGGLLAAAFLNRMEYDVMKLEPAQMTSIKMYYKVLDKFDVNIMSAMAVADSVEEARQQLGKHPVDLVLLDLSLVGGEDGLTLAKEMRSSKKWQKTPMIAVTAHAFSSDRDNVLEAGCEDFLTKPVKQGLLLEKISTYLKNGN